MLEGIMQSHANLFLWDDFLSNGLPYTAVVNPVPAEHHFLWSNIVEWGYYMTSLCAMGTSGMIEVEDTLKRIGLTLSTMEAIQGMPAQYHEKGLFYAEYNL